MRILRYFRFYGRIVPDVDRHDAATLKTIRETADGLRGVSVERVWMEVKRILIGNHAPHLMNLMYELNVAESIGKSFFQYKILQLILPMGTAKCNTMS